MLECTPGHLVPSMVDEQVPGTGSTASYHDHMRVQHINETGERNAEIPPYSLEGFQGRQVPFKPRVVDIESCEVRKRAQSRSRYADRDLFCDPHHRRRRRVLLET